MTLKEMSCIYINRITIFSFKYKMTTKIQNQNDTKEKTIEQLKKEAQHRAFRREYMKEYRRKMTELNTPLKYVYDINKNKEKCKEYYRRQIAIVDIKNLFSDKSQ